MTSILITETDRRKAFDLFNQDETVGRVATLLFTGHWYKAKKLREEYDKREEPVPTPAPVLETSIALPEPEIVVDQEQEADGAAELEDGEPAVWDLQVQVPTASMDRILANFTPQEKADAIASVLTARLSAEG